jgi:hypothetical protein
MGKRELLLLIGFLAFGFVVYQVTAPAPNPERESFSFSKFMGQLKAEMHGETAESSVTRTATAEPPAGSARLVIPEYRGTLTLVGEDREDIAAELQAVVYGLDENQAEARAKNLALSLDKKHGDDLYTMIEWPSDAKRRPRLDLTVKLPTHVPVLLELRYGEANVRHLASIRFGEARGKVRITEVDTVEGSFVNGDVEILKAGTVDLTLRRTPTRIEHVLHALKLEADHGDLWLRQVDGETTLKLERLDCDLEELKGPGTFDADHVKLEVTNIAAPVTVRARHTSVKATLARAVPMNIETSDEQLDVHTPEEGVTIDARVQDGQIRVTNQGEKDESEKDEKDKKDEQVERDDKQPNDSVTKRSLHARGEDHKQLKLHGGGPTVTLRNTRGDIVIR